MSIKQRTKLHKQCLCRGGGGGRFTTRNDALAQRITIAKCNLWVMIHRVTEIREASFRSDIHAMFSYLLPGWIVYNQNCYIAATNQAISALYATARDAMPCFYSRVRSTYNGLRVYCVLL